ncbi:hypothetical protein MXL46_13890 [Heyndrickxia sporothermodurans]|uniref:Uncharacterized protein n=1 Tax=Heyndrickxia sporothermodurans TaxID=46224 RepID=A0AB37HDQ6_9BACI|nr:hypothetical protein [Heyndrickxia sporothermodurans]MBL5768430.1 hypothetical protein [Heyndrickxia sporothermodurans]MBL5772090.1 hypothetical protein [Heyndrickxia sporothermodurans]MBL5776184.1 hypothetical protein [Heyndrickxia sporothermodurans]MBL5779333.1 hypothetical protein [Heyndrickxia sporothermodurans]MBL5783377.1 hypothetical protein [Heyndrickxia sporothermodurans]
MDHILTYILLLPLILWSIFQAPLYNNAAMVEESLKLAIYEGQKEASLKGKYDANIYKEMRDYLVNTHNYKADSINIKGTETLTPRGGKMTIEVTVPKPVVTVMDIFKVDTSEPFKVKKTILSERIN